jgi:hypothetical protein
MPGDAASPVTCRTCGIVAPTDDRNFEALLAAGWIVIGVVSGEGSVKAWFCPKDMGSVEALLQRHPINESPPIHRDGG